ncbi:MAG: hypothetical protein SFY96_09015 [Planctomycetota bacterium]|nr:hypothetical protein [Planctomycetota bacterium]
MPAPRAYFAIPSACPERCRITLRAWREQGYGTAVLADAKSSAAESDFGADVVVRVDRYEGWPASVNFLCRQVVPRECPVVVTGGDDILPDPRHSCEQLVNEFLQRFPDTFGIMQARGDTFMAAHQYCGSPFIGRAWFERMYAGAGGLFSGYRHNYADNELQWLARGMGVLWDRPDLTQAHEHFSRAGSAAPSHWGGVVASDLQDCLLYYARAQSGFPGHEPIADHTQTLAFRPPPEPRDMLLLAEQRLIHTALDNPCAQAVAAALQQAAAAGHDPVGIFGYGLFAQSAANALREPPVQIACFIDDDPQRQGRMAWNIPVVSRAQAAAMGIRGVVLAARSVHAQLRAASATFRDAGITVYGLDDHDARTSVA